MFLSQDVISIVKIVSHITDEPHSFVKLIRMRLRQTFIIVIAQDKLPSLLEYRLSAVKGGQSFIC